MKQKSFIELYFATQPANQFRDGNVSYRFGGTWWEKMQSKSPRSWEISTRFVKRYINLFIRYINTYKIFKSLEKASKQITKQITGKNRQNEWMNETVYVV